MAELAPIEEKLAEVLGLARAAQDVTEKVARLARDEGEDEVREMLESMNREAAETEERCAALAEDREGKKTAIEEKARETRQEAGEMMKTYLGDGADTLDGLEFMTMAEAGELGHVEIVGAMAQEAAEPAFASLAEFALAIQQRHFDEVRQAALRLARAEASED